MAAILKKRALAQYSQTVQETPFQAPVKRLRLVKKRATEFSTLSLVNSLETCKDSNEVLRTLLLLSDNLSFDVGDIPETILKLSAQFKNEKESAVRVKILSLLAEIGQEVNADISLIIEDVITLLKHETSHKVIAQGLSSLMILCNLIPDNAQMHLRVVDLAKSYLKDVNHNVKCKCLEIIGTLIPIGANINLESEKIVQLVTSYFNNDDARVRSQAFSTIITLHERGIKINPDMYNDVCAALKDDYEIVRKVVLKVICLIGRTYPENTIVLPDSEQEIRLIDDAFGKVCIGVTDLSMHVRTLAAKLLGSMNQVSSRFLNQTLDKKLMSNMRRKRTAHELAWENVTSGEWASGKKWADDAPREVLDADSINLMSSGACGAFVHGLEDEFLEVRTAAVESLCQLSLNNPTFANLSLDFLVDMFNDEIEDVRLIAIDSLRRVSEHIVLRDDQLETILGALEDFSQEVREGLHRMLASCRISTTYGLKICIEKLLDNLKRYSQDKRSTYQCLQLIGLQHPELVLMQVPQLLAIHPFFDMAEPDVDSPHYICLLILVFNAAKHSPTIITLLEDHTLRHYSYLRDTMPNLVPELPISETISCHVVRPLSVPESLQFLKTIVDSLEVTDNNLKVQSSLLQTAKDHLNRLSDMDPSVSGTAKFMSLYIGAQLLMSQILEQGLWNNPANIPTQQAINLRTNIQQLLQNCLMLQHLFVGLSNVETCAVKQFRLRALALNLVFIVKGSNASALAPCHHFLSVVEEMHKELYSAGIAPDAFTTAVFKDLSAIEEPKPGAVARILIPILSEANLGKIPEPNVEIQMSSAIIHEPSGQTEKQHKFTAGLVLAVPFQAELRHLSDRTRLRLKIKYPDQRTQIILPRPNHFRSLLFENADEKQAGHSMRLITTVLISHQVWSEACNVEISLALAIPDSDVSKRKNPSDSLLSLLDLCKPVKVSVAPKPIKRTL